MRRAAISALLALSVAFAPYRPADALTPGQAALIVGTISGGLWAGIFYFYHKIGADKCSFQPSANSYYDLAGDVRGSSLSTITELCGPAEMDVAAILRSGSRDALLVVQPNPDTGWDFEARFQHSSCSNSFDHQLSVAVNAFFTCLNSGNYTTSRPIYAISANGTSPPSGASVYNWSAGDLGGGKYGWTR